MVDNVNPHLSSYTSTSFLPRFYRTPANTKFLQATLDQLIQAGTVKKLNGYIGQQSTKSTNADDLFIRAADTTRQNYQLEPSIVIDDVEGNNIFFKDYQDYINQLTIFGGNTSNHARLNSQEFYSWDPHIDWDKFINFQNYYWIPEGPPLLVIAGTQRTIASTIRVAIEPEGDNYQYIFTPDGLTPDPVLTLYRGNKYTFDIASTGNPFSIMTRRTTNASGRYITPSLSKQAISNGTITFTVPDDSPDILYYQSEHDIDLGGTIHILDNIENSSLNVGTEILGMLTYTTKIDGKSVDLSNGMRVQFSGEVLPAKYAEGEYFVEGVGTAIKLINTLSIQPMSVYASRQIMPYGDAPYGNTSSFDEGPAYNIFPDYIIINRASKDCNQWSRFNRWFHKDVIQTSAELANTPLILTSRATRPIIEFEADLQLFNTGPISVPDVDLIDGQTTDIFSIIEGATGYIVDGVNLIPGHRVLFIADTDHSVRNNIYRVELVDLQHLSENGKSTGSRLHLVLDSTPVENQGVIALSGTEYCGTLYNYVGTSWVVSQQKKEVNQAPLFDVFDSNGISFSDAAVYTGTDFTGTKLFSYKLGNGTNDATLGFPLTYKNINNIGDIVFNFYLATDEFQYDVGFDKVKHLTNTGFLSRLTYTGGAELVNGWQLCKTAMTQAAIRIYRNTNKVNNFDIDIFDDVAELDDLTVQVNINGNRLSATQYDVTTGVVYKQVVLHSNITINDVLTIKAYAKQPTNDRGYYELPINLQHNPLNGLIGDFTLSEVIDHGSSIVDNIQQIITGNFPGSNNTRDLGNITQYGTKFVQHSGPLSLAMYHITSDENNAIRAVGRSKDDYASFKRTFLTTAGTIGIDADAVTLVDLILQKINKDKPDTAPYFFSDMAPFGASLKTSYVVADLSYSQYLLSNTFSLTELSTKSVTVYINGVQLLVNHDYIFTTHSTVQIIAPRVIGDRVEIYEYESTDGCFIPETPTKLGLWPASDPKIYLDTTLVTPVNLIQGHDGSLTVAYGDYRDDLLLDLEKRIYNNIKVQYDTTLFDMYDFIPSYSRTTDYSLAEFNEVLAPMFYKWSASLGQDYASSLQDLDNPFTYDYTNYAAPDGRQTPGHWRGLYQWILGTDRPHLCPWEMLGFSDMPSWWHAVYGPAPYTSNNLVLWQDICDGVIKEPNRPPVTLPKFKKPFLMEHIPVDENGILINPIISGLASGTLSASGSKNYIFGDIGPIENAWRRSSHYPYSVIIAAMLLLPAKTFGVLLDRSRIKRNVAGQLIYTPTDIRISPNSIKTPSTYTSTHRVQTAGIINYINNNLIQSSQYAYELSNISCKLSYRVGGFTSKEKFSLILKSKNPIATGSLYIPVEDYSIILNTSTPVKKLVYSGVIITGLVDGFEIKGYSHTQPYFKYYQWIQTGTTINVGGISESYTTWTEGRQYTAGKIVKHGDTFFRVKALITATMPFDMTYYQRLDTLPIVGGRDAKLRKQWDRTKPIVIPYGTKFTEIQEVVDFLLGYGEWLIDQGFMFDSFNSVLGQIDNWQTSVREYLFWTTQHWVASSNVWQDWQPNKVYAFDSTVRYCGAYYRVIVSELTTALFNANAFAMMHELSSIGQSVISVSPSASGIMFKTALGVVDSIENPLNDYEIVRVDGQPILPGSLSAYTKDAVARYEPTTDDGIYGASFYIIQQEQVLILNNTTRFNDLIFNPASGYRQTAIKVNGYVSSDWQGGFSAPGFIFDQAAVKIWAAWEDYAAGEVVKHQTLYYSANSTLSGTAAFLPADWHMLSGKPSPALIPNWSYKADQFTDFYSLDSDNFDINQQKMAQHLIGYQKRQYLSNIIQDDVSEFKFYQGMLADKGTNSVLNKLFDVLSAADKESVIFHEEWALRVGQYGASSSFDTIELILDEAAIVRNPQCIELSNQPAYSSSDFIVTVAPADVYVKPTGYNSEPWPMATANTAILRSAGYIHAADTSLQLATLADIVAEDVNSLNVGDYIWCAFDNSSWNVYRYTETALNIINVTENNGVITFIADDFVPLINGMYIGITNTAIPLLDGFYKVDAVSLTSFNITTPTAIDRIVIANIIIFTLASQRAASIADVNATLPKKIKNNELLWIDAGENGIGETWQHSTVYDDTVIDKPSVRYAADAFGCAIALTPGGDTLVVSSALPEVYIFDGIADRTARQVLVRPFISNASIDGIAKETILACNNRWLAIGYPNVSHAAYTTRAVLPAVTFTSDTASDASFTNQGVVSIYEKDQHNTYGLVGTLVSKTPATDARFGASIAFNGDTMLVGAPGDNKIYSFIYTDVIKTSATFVSNTNNIIDLENINNLSNLITGLYVSGTGFTSGQVIIAFTTSPLQVTLSAAPDSTPDGVINFVTHSWIHGDALLTPASTPKVGSSLSLSADGSTLAVYGYTGTAKNGNVYIYSYAAGLYTYSSTITGERAQFGILTTLSDNGEYLAIADNAATDTKNEQGLVKVYARTSITYALKQVIKSQSPESAAYFGSNIAFMNNAQTLVVYSKYADSSLAMTFDDNTTIYDSGSTQFIDTTVDSGRVDIYDFHVSLWLFGESLPKTNSVIDQYGAGFAVSANHVLIGAPTASINSISCGRIYQYSKPTNASSWQVIRSEIKKTDVYKIKKAVLYNRVSNQLVAYLDVIDPLQGKISGIAEQEITYKVFYDPAVYSINTGAEVAATVDPGAAWTTQQVGTLWWDLRTAKFIESYDTDLSYRTSSWNTLAQGASIDIYEWVESQFLPTEWDSRSDTTAGLSAGISGKSLYADVYSIKSLFDEVSKTIKYTYYFWVNQKTTVPSANNRKLSAATVSNLIKDPRGEGYKCIAITGSNSISLVNVNQLLYGKDIVLSVDYWLHDKIDQNIHSQWQLMSKDSMTPIPAMIESKWFDSLSGVDIAGRTVPDPALPYKLLYGIEYHPNQSMFVNRMEALKQLIERANAILLANQIVDTRSLIQLALYDAEPSFSSGLYDVVVDTDSELKFTKMRSFKRPVIRVGSMPDGKVIDIIVQDSGSGYQLAPLITIVGSGINAKMTATINSDGQLTGATVINPGEGYLSDTKLLVRDYSVLVRSDSTSNNKWSIYAYSPITHEWYKTLTQTYDTRNFWSYADWYASGYSKFSAIAYAVNTFDELQYLNSKIYNLIKVRVTNSGNWVLLEKYANVTSYDWTASHRVVGIQNGTIQINSAIYSYKDTILGYDGAAYDSNGYDNYAAMELRAILSAFKDDIFIDDLKHEYLNLFFASIHYALSEQLYVDWVFKTSMVKATHNVGYLSQPATYKNDNLTDFSDYIAEVKPYRTVIREYVSAYRNLDRCETHITDFDLPPTLSGIIGTTVTNDVISHDTVEAMQQAPWKDWKDNVGFEVTSIQVIDHGIGYLSEPDVVIISVSGSGAVAKAHLVNGKIDRITVLAAGSGYLSAPTIVIADGVTVTGRIATAAAHIGNSLIKTTLVNIKFDRITSSHSVMQLDTTDTFIGNGANNRYTLSWPIDASPNNTTVKIDDTIMTHDLYTVSTVVTTKFGFTSYAGLVIFNNTPVNSARITINYLKDSVVLNAADRIQHFYAPTTGQLGNDLAQLMTGIDYGGVIVTGLDFVVNTGWDSLPYLSDKWDSIDPKFDDVFKTATAGQHQFVLPYNLPANTEINVYYTAINSDVTIRLDDPDYKAGVVLPNRNAIMVPQYKKTINIPNTQVVAAGDQFIFRKSTSDGSLAPADTSYDTALSGGDFEYLSAAGIASDDIIIDGSAFSSPLSGNAPEEVVPGHIVEAVAIKIYEQPLSTTANIKVVNYIANGNNTIFDIGQLPNSAEAVIVKIETLQMQSAVQTMHITKDYTVDYNNQRIEFVSPPVSKSVVSIFSIGFGGSDIIAINSMQCNGIKTQYITTFAWLSYEFTALVFVDGYPVVHTVTSVKGRVAFTFNSAPAASSVIYFILTRGTQRTTCITKTERIACNNQAASLPYNLTNIIGDSAPIESSMIVRVDQTILRGPSNHYFTIGNNALTYTMNSVKIAQYPLVAGKVAVIADGVVLTNTQYTLNLVKHTVTLTGLTYATYNNKVLTISNSAAQEYTYIPPVNGASAAIQFKTKLTSTQIVEVTSSYKHDILDMHTEYVSASIPNVMIPYSASYYQYAGVSGGIITLERAVLKDDQVWVMKNKTLLAHSMDYKLNYDNTSITLSAAVRIGDVFDIVTYTAAIQTPLVAYMQFKDMLNRTHYKRLNANKRTTLAENLMWSDIVIKLVDVRGFDIPDAKMNMPGVVYIRGERIEYFKIIDNELHQLRRSTLGTSCPTIHLAGTFVQDIGPSETLPYIETPMIQHLVATERQTSHFNLEAVFKATEILQNHTFVLNAIAGDTMFYASPVEYGQVSFADENGTNGGWNASEIVSVGANPVQFYIYNTTQPGMGSITWTASYSMLIPRNVIYHGVASENSLKNAELITAISTQSTTQSTMFRYDNGDLSNVHDLFGNTNELELFVGGYADADWQPNTIYAIGSFFRAGVSTYHVKSSFMSGDSFTADAYTVSSGLTEWLPATDYIIDQLITHDAIIYKSSANFTSPATFDTVNMMLLSELDYTTPVSYLTPINFFVSNIRLKKHAYTAFDINLAASSPAGDVQFQADFALGNTGNVTLTTPIAAKTKLTVIKQTGTMWGDASLWVDNSACARFIRAVPGSSDININE